MIQVVRKLAPQLWVWGPVVGLMLVIFIASAQPKNPPPPGAGPVYLSGLMPVFEGAAETLVKKGSHVMGYGLLALAFMRAFGLHGHPLRRAAYLALACTMGYALTDELHQAFVPGRHASALDIGFDYVGATSALLIRGRLSPLARAKSKALPGARGEHTQHVPDRQTHGFK
ncbi:MAG: VanZ family protein [Chloroflexi bacterium]|nr:VanZ family protein [Chloroflexota bacterium]